MLKADFHTHTNHVLKNDSIISPKQMINLAAKNNIEVLSITDHRSESFLYKIKKCKGSSKTYNHIKDYAKKKGILLIPGMEIHVEGKETLLINLNDEYKDLTFDDLYDLKEENVLVMAPHPFYGRSKCLGKKIEEHHKLFDAIEISHLYTNFFNPNKKAIEIAEKYKKTLVANSDAHLPWHINLQFNLLDCEKNIDSVLEAIRKNKVIPQTKPLPLNLFIKDMNWVILSYIKENTKEIVRDIFKG